MREILQLVWVLAAVLVRTSSLLALMGVAGSLLLGGATLEPCTLFRVPEATPVLVGWRSSSSPGSRAPNRRLLSSVAVVSAAPSEVAVLFLFALGRAFEALVLVSFLASKYEC